MRRARGEQDGNRQANMSNSLDKRPRRQGRPVNYNDSCEDDVREIDRSDADDDDDEAVRRTDNGFKKESQGHYVAGDDDDTSEDNFRPLATPSRAARGVCCLNIPVARIQNCSNHAQMPHLLSETLLGFIDNVSVACGNKV